MFPRFVKIYIFFDILVSMVLGIWKIISRFYVSGHKLICCESAVKDFRVIVDTLGGEGEKVRSKILLEQIIDQVVPDGMSDRLKNLDLSGKIKERSRAIFGTGDFYQVFIYFWLLRNQFIRLVRIFSAKVTLSSE